MLSFGHLVFLEVAKAESFTKASQTLFITQPAISKHIRQLEEAYGAPLFDRNGNSIALTQAGKILFDGIQEAKGISDRTHFDISSLSNDLLAKGELKIGASTTVALYMIPSVLSEFHRKHPQLKIILINRNSENVLKALLDREIDLGIIEGENKSFRVHSEPFLTDEVIPVCSSSSPLARISRMTVKDLRKHPVALRERGSGTLAALRTALTKSGMKLADLNTGVRLSGTEALKNFILADECIGFLPLRSVEKELKSGTLIRLNIAGLKVTRQFYFIQRHGEKHGGINMSFIRLAKRHHNLK